MIVLGEPIYLCQLHHHPIYSHFTKKIKGTKQNFNSCIVFLFQHPSKRRFKCVFPLDAIFSLVFSMKWLMNDILKCRTILLMVINFCFNATMKIFPGVLKNENVVLFHRSEPRIPAPGQEIPRVHTHHAQTTLKSLLAWTILHYFT